MVNSAPRPAGRWRPAARRLEVVEELLGAGRLRRTAGGSARPSVSTLYQRCGTFANRSLHPPSVSSQASTERSVESGAQVAEPLDWLVGKHEPEVALAAWPPSGHRRSRDIAVSEEALRCFRAGQADGGAVDE